MSTELTQSAKKTLEFQEMGQVLRAAEQARRTSFAFLIPIVITLLGLTFSKGLSFPACAFAVIGIGYTLYSSLLNWRYSRTIVDAKERLLILQKIIGISVYPDSFSTGRDERIFYSLAYYLVLFVFFIALLYCL